MTSNLTHDPVTGLPIAADDDYDYVADVLRDDPKRHLPKDCESVGARQHEANSRGQPYFPTPWECQELGKWWNVPEDEHTALIQAETAEHPWQEMIEARIDADPALYAGRDDETPTRWDGTLADTTNWGNTITITRIGIAWLGLSPEQLGRGMAHTKTISAIMRHLGWKLRRQRIEGQRTQPWVWVNPESIRNETDEIAERARELMNISRTDNDDIPF